MNYLSEEYKLYRNIDIIQSLIDIPLPVKVTEGDTEESIRKKYLNISFPEVPYAGDKEKKDMLMKLLSLHINVLKLEAKKCMNLIEPIMKEMPERRSHSEIDEIDSLF